MHSLIFLRLLTVYEKLLNKLYFNYSAVPISLAQLIFCS